MQSPSEEIRDPLLIAEGWMAEGRDVAIATVVETWGSAPRPVGSHLVIDEAGNFEGSVSGGCVEGSVITEAMEVISQGKPRMLEFGVADSRRDHIGDLKQLDLAGRRPRQKRVGDKSNPARDLEAGQGVAERGFYRLLCG